MEHEVPYTFKVRIPSDIDYVPPVRKFVAELLQVQRFNPKFSFRSEVIVDEICYNAVTYGSQSQDATIELTCSIFSDRVEFLINDEGGSAENVQRLKEILNKKDEQLEQEIRYFKSNKGLGLEIVRMLSSEMDMNVGTDNVTSIRIVKKREEN